MTSSRDIDSDPRVARDAPSPRRDRLLLVGEFCALVALAIADAKGLVPLSRTPFLLLLWWASLLMRRLPWRDIGFARPPRMRRTIAIGVVAGLAIELFAVNVTTPWIAR
jgi:hypothetical protein